MSILDPGNAGENKPARVWRSRVWRPRPSAQLFRRWRRPALWGLLGLVVIWLVVAGVMLALGLLDASHGVTHVHEAQGRLSASELVSQGPLGPLKAAHGDFESASSLLRSPVLAPLEVVPVLGRQVRSVRDLSVAATEVSRIGVSAVTQVRTVLDVPHPAGPQRVATLRQLAQLADTTYASLSRVNLGPSVALVGPLATKHDQFANELARVRGELTHSAGVARTVASILQGPQSYLVMMANNAEMRAGSGAFLELGVLSGDGGHVRMSDPVPSASMNVPPGKVPVTGDLAANWGWLKPGVDWRNLGVTPQFDVNGALAAQMWQAATGQHVDGVMAVDIETLHQLLEVTGPVTLNGGKVVDAGNVVPFLTHDQYAGLTSAEAAQTGQQARQDQLGALARNTLDALEGQSLNLKVLADAMTVSTSGRHLLMWSSNPSDETVWQKAGVGGALSPNSITAAVVNRGGNKLDQYLAVRAGLALTPRDGGTDATLTVDLDNHTPPGQVSYIAGPFPGLGTTYGEYVGQLALNLPAAAQNLRLAGNPPISAKGPEGPAWLLATPVDVKAGQSERVVVTFTLPGGHATATAIPSARLSPVSWRFPGGTSTDASSFTISW